MTEKKIKTLIEDPIIYDGWIAKVYEDDTIELRDFYVTQKWSEEKKKEFVKELEEMVSRTNRDTECN